MRRSSSGWTTSWRWRRRRWLRSGKCGGKCGQRCGGSLCEGDMLQVQLWLQGGCIRSGCARTGPNHPHFLDFRTSALGHAGISKTGCPPYAYAPVPHLNHSHSFTLPHVFHAQWCAGIPSHTSNHPHLPHIHTYLFAGIPRTGCLPAPAASCARSWSTWWTAQRCSCPLPLVPPGARQVQGCTCSSSSTRSAV